MMLLAGRESSRLFFCPVITFQRRGRVFKKKIETFNVWDLRTPTHRCYLYNIKQRYSLTHSLPNK